MKRGSLIAMALAILALVRLAGPPAARAAGVVGSGTAASCTDGALRAALAGGGLVTFNCGRLAVTINSNPGAGGTGTKTIGNDTTIDGAGLITISGGNGVLVFRVNGGVTFTVQNLTIADGNGGGISNMGGTLIVSNSTFSGNSASGGIFSRDGTVIVSDSTFSGNSASRGGGIFFNNSDDNDGATLSVSNSTFSGNSADRGGGIDILVPTPDGSGPLIVSSCTFSGNSAVNSGGGIQNDAIADPLTVANTILVSNAGGNCGFDSATVAIIDGGHNLDDGTTCGFSGSNTNPQLDPAGLRDNGGPTHTIALQPGSPAINAGDEALCAAPPVNDVDQRGFVRPGTGATNCSIGAYEYTLPQTSDCCECPTSCAAPIEGSCGDCDVVFNATCRSGALCVLHTPTPTPSPTSSLPPTLTPSPTPSPIRTPITPSPTPTLGPSECCQCASFCAAPINGTCGGCVVVLGASCTSGSQCVAHTPTPTPMRPCMGDCNRNGQVTVDELVTMVDIALGMPYAAACPLGVPLGTCVQNGSFACNTDDDCNPLPGGACAQRDSGTRAPGAPYPDVQVTVAEIVTGVNNALNGCAG